VVIEKNVLHKFSGHLALAEHAPCCRGINAVDQAFATGHFRGALWTHTAVAILQSNQQPTRGHIEVSTCDLPSVLQPQQKPITNLKTVPAQNTILSLLKSVSIHHIATKFRERTFYQASLGHACWLTCTRIAANREVRPSRQQISKSAAKPLKQHASEVAGCSSIGVSTIQAASGNFSYEFRRFPNIWMRFACVDCF
jgi:hypothetical protein